MENQPANRTPEDDDDGSDRISQLPESVLLHILCFLSLKKAVQTCVLSKSWRHLGSTRPVIDLRGSCDWTHTGRTHFCENCFDGNSEAFLSAVDDTFQRYHVQNIYVQELNLEMLEVDSQSISLLHKWIPLFVNPNALLTSFRLFVGNYVHVADRKPGSFTRFDLPSALFKVESLENLHLDRCKISSIENAALRNLRKLSLFRVYIDDESLEKIISGCPLVEYVKLRFCQGMKTISITKANGCLKGLKFLGCNVKNIELDVIEIDAPTLQSIHIQICSSWKLNHNNYFPHLKSLYLFCVQLPTEPFDNFSCNFPLLEEFSIFYCTGFEEIKLFSQSLKQLNIKLNSSIKVAIDAPNILCFMFSGTHIPTALSFTETSGEWKSDIDMDTDEYAYAGSLLVKLIGMVKALSQSQISLTLSDDLVFEEKQIGWGSNDHAAVEHLRILHIPLMVFDSISLTYFLNNLFCIFRPRYVGEVYYLCTDEVAECVWKTLVHGKEKREYSWQPHLKEVTIEVSDAQQKVWHHAQWTCFPESASSMHQAIRFRLKWMD